MLPQKAVFFPLKKILVIADMHIGKLVHFRRKGIFAPLRKTNEDLEMMLSLIRKFQPTEVVFLGDLFHSEINSECGHFIKTIEHFPEIRFTLTKGNHDIIPDALFKETGIEITDERLLDNHLVLRHQLPEKRHEEFFYIIGHIHPGYRFQGKGRQRYSLPCFHLTNHSLTLPAFGIHTGMAIPDFLNSDEIYVIMNEEIIRMPC